MDTFTDPRDGNTYNAVEINGQVWLAENLRFKGVEYHAPDGDEDNIIEYGCLYTWDNAMKACPEGWHLPSKEEYDNLLEYSGSDKSDQFKTLAALGWGGDNSLGFRVLPAGQWWKGNYYFFGINASVWSSTERKENSIFRAYRLNVSESIICTDYIREATGLSVRCIKD